MRPEATFRVAEHAALTLLDNEALEANVEGRDMERMYDKHKEKFWRTHSYKLPKSKEVRKRIKQLSSTDPRDQFRRLHNVVAPSDMPILSEGSEPSDAQSITIHHAPKPPAPPARGGFKLTSQELIEAKGILSKEKYEREFQLDPKKTRKRMEEERKIRKTLIASIMSVDPKASAAGLDSLTYNQLRKVHERSGAVPIVPTRAQTMHSQRIAHAMGPFGDTGLLPPSRPAIIPPDESDYSSKEAGSSGELSRGGKITWEEIPTDSAELIELRNILAEHGAFDLSDERNTLEDWRERAFAHFGYGQGAHGGSLPLSLHDHGVLFPQDLPAVPDVPLGVRAGRAAVPHHVQVAHRNVLHAQARARQAVSGRPGVQFSGYVGADRGGQVPPFGRVHLVQMANIAGPAHFMHELVQDANMGRIRVETSRRGPFRGTSGHIKTMARSTHVVYRVRGGVIQITIYRDVLKTELDVLVGKLGAHRISTDKTVCTLVVGGRKRKLGNLQTLDLSALRGAILKSLSKSKTVGISLHDIGKKGSLHRMHRPEREYAS